MTIKLAIVILNGRCITPTQNLTPHLQVTPFSIFSISVYIATLCHETLSIKSLLIIPLKYFYLPLSPFNSHNMIQAFTFLTGFSASRISVF